MHGSTTGECERVWEVLRVPFPDRAYLPVLTELIAKRPGPTHFEERHLNRPESCPIPCPLSLSLFVFLFLSIHSLSLLPFLCFRFYSFIGLSNQYFIPIYWWRHFNRAIPKETGQWSGLLTASFLERPRSFERGTRVFTIQFQWHV